MKKRLVRLLKEPLLHFVLAGALLFVLYDLVAPDARDYNRILVSEGQVDALKARFSRTWQRPPSGQELQSLIEQHVLDEIYYREALALGIDDNDAMIRRRLRQKMEFLVEDTLSLMTPTAAELQQYHAAYPDEFTSEARYSFEQLYVNTDRSEQDLAQRVAALDAGLSAGRVMNSDTTLLEREYHRASATQIDRSFGEGFSRQLDALEPSAWSEPLKSGLGLHFVYLREREPGKLQPLDKVRAEVERRWAYRKRRQLTEELQQRLLAKYEIVVEAGGDRDG